MNMTIKKQNERKNRTNEKTERTKLTGKQDERKQNERN